MMTEIEGSKSATIRISRTRRGNASTMSVKRMMRGVDSPAEVAGQAPSSVPSATLITVATKPIESEMRAP